MSGLEVRVQVQELHTRLREKLAAGGPAQVVGDVTRTFLEISTEAVDKGLWSLEFFFDEDDSRLACLEARFGNGIEAERTGTTLRGYAVRLLLPKILPKGTLDGSTSSKFLHTMQGDRESLVTRFVRALDELGTYRFIEALQTKAIETQLL